MGQTSRGRPSDAVLDLMQRTVCAVGGTDTLAEVAAVSLARHLVKKGRRLDARRILRAFLRLHPATPYLAAAWAATL